MLFSKFEGFFKSEYRKNILTLLFGTSLAQVLPILASPLLTRLYTPDEFGSLAVFMSVVILVGTISSGKYELAVVLPSLRSKAMAVVRLCFIISLLVAAVFMLLVLFFHNTFISLLDSPGLTNWLYLAPLVALMVAVFLVFNYYNTRNKAYRIISAAKIFKSGTGVISQIALAFSGLGAGGLILGYSLSHFAGNALMLKSFRKDKVLFLNVNWKQIKKVAKRYQKFPKYTLPGNFANKASYELMNPLISMLFSITTLGFYSLAYRILAVPTSFIGASYSQVYMQMATEERRKSGKSLAVFFSVLKQLVIIGLPLYIILFFISEELFAFVFGEEWRTAGYYAKLLSPLLLIRFVVSPLAITLSVFEKQQISVILQFGMFFFMLLSFGLSYYFGFTVEEFFFLYVPLLSVYYLFLLYTVYRVAAAKL